MSHLGSLGTSNSSSTTVGFPDAEGLDLKLRIWIWKSGKSMVTKQQTSHGDLKGFHGSLLTFNNFYPGLMGFNGILLGH